MSDSLDRFKAALAERYAIQEELGAGGMATVYLAHDVKHDRKVAVKVLRPELAAVLGAERFLLEIKTTANLQHPHILPLFDSGEADGLFYYVMPYIEGESLRQRLAHEQRLAIDEVLAITHDVAAALAYAHSQGVIHRDVKPENIMFHHGEPLVGDFGIALAVASAGGERLTETGWSMGTPAYMSPEQVAGEREVDARSDVYGLACVVFEMLVGAPPYDGPTPAAIIRNQASQSVPSILQERSEAAPHIDAAVSRALANDPDHRFDSIDAFATALSSAKPSPPVVPLQADPHSPDSATTIAVLPFLNRSPDADSAFFADGVTDDIMAQLSKIPALRVISRRSTERYRESDEGIATIASDLGADVILEGTIRRASQRVRVVAELIDVRADRNVWSETYDRELTDVFAIQSNIAISIATALEKNLSPAEQEELATQPTKDLEAYDLYLLGLHHWTKRSDEGIRRGIQYLTEALQRDPTFTRAKTAMAEAYLFAGIGYASIPLREGQSKALELARDVLAKDDSLAEAHATLALALLVGEWNPQAGLESAKRAIALNQNSATAHQWSAWCHLGMGEHVPALEAWHRAIKLDPVSAVLMTESGWPLSFVGLHAEARKRYLRAVELEPEFALAQYNVGFSYDREGNTSEALEWYERALLSSGGMPLIKGHLGALLIRVGENTRAGEILTELHAAVSDGYPAFTSIAQVEDARGNVDEALDALERAFDAHEPLMPWVANPGFMPFEKLRSTARFKKLVERPEFPEPDLVAERARVERWLAEQKNLESRI